jgi:hypothetical protein
VTSYVLRQFGGVCYGGSAHWPEKQDIQSAMIANAADGLPSTLLLTVEGQVTTDARPPPAGRHSVTRPHG